MTHQILKDFWINKINNLITTFSLDPSLLTEGVDWANKINALDRWREIDVLGINICHDVYAKLGKTAPVPLCAVGENYGEVLDNSFDDYELQFIDLANVCKTKIGVDPTNDINILVDGHTIPKWKHTINSKFPVNASHKQFTLNDLGSLDIVDFLYRNDLYETIIDKTNGLGDLIETNLTGNDQGKGYGYRWPYKVNKTVLQNYKNNQTFIFNVGNRLKTILGLAPTAAIPNDWHTKLVKKTDLDAYENGLKAVLNNNLTDWQNKLNQGQQKASEYDRIHTKLNGKVSDSDLDNLLNQTPSCSHTDYDTIKQERDDLKQQKDNYSTEKQQAIQDKEKEIINKIITDLGLTTERERERERALEAVITEIKSKLTPPACAKCPGKDSKISELQEQITNLQTPKTLKDLPISQGIKEEVIKISQDLGLTTQSCAKLEKATSYQELSSLQKQAFQEKLEQETSDKNSANSLNWALGILTLGSLLALAWMIMKQNKGILPESDKGEK